MSSLIPNTKKLFSLPLRKYAHVVRGSQRWLVCWLLQQLHLCFSVCSMQETWNPKWLIHFLFTVLVLTWCRRHSWEWFVWWPCKQDQNVLVTKHLNVELTGQTDQTCLITVQLKRIGIKCLLMLKFCQTSDQTRQGFQIRKCLATKQGLIMFGLQTFPVWTGLKITQRTKVKE